MNMLNAIGKNTGPRLLRHGDNSTIARDNLGYSSICGIR